MTLSKNEARKKCFDNARRIKKDYDITVDIYKSNIINNEQVIAIYYPLETEFNVLGLMDIYPDKIFCFPRVEGNGLDFYIVKNIFALEKGPFKTSQPSKENDKIEVKNIGAFFLPCIGINKKGYRLGYGKGYYDRALSNCQGKKIGICLSENCDIDFLEEYYDLKLDYIFKR